MSGTVCGGDWNIGGCRRVYAVDAAGRIGCRAARVLVVFRAYFTNLLRCFAFRHGVSVHIRNI